MLFRSSQGSVVGINTSGLSRGHALTIPTQTIRRVTDAILAQGHVSRGYLGVGMQPVELPADLAARLALTQTRGLMLVSVEEKGPAAKAGLLLGDILIQLDQRGVTDTGDVQALLGSDSVGKILAARLIRGGALTTVSVTVGDRQ